MIIISSLVLVTLTTYIKASSTIENQVSVYLEQIVNNVNLQIDEYLKNYERATLPLITSQEVRKFLDRGTLASYESFVEFNEIKKDMNGMITERPEIEQIYLMGKLESILWQMNLEVYFQ